MSFLVGFFWVADAYAADTASDRAIRVVWVAVGVGIITAYALYKVAHAKKKVEVGSTIDAKAAAGNIAKTSSGLIQQKIKELPLDPTYVPAAVLMVSKLVEEEAQRQVRNLREEYSVQQQVMVQQKNKEIEVVKKQYKEAKDRYDIVDRMYKKADAEKKTTEAVVRSIAEGLVVVNEHGEVLLMNPSAEKLLGVQKEKKIGQSILDGVYEELMVSLTKTRQSGEAQEKVVEFRTKNENVKKILRASSAVIQNEEGQTVGMVNVLTDVTKQRELDEVKNKFVSNVTHELRTPIVAMQKAIAVLQTAAAGELTEAQNNFINILSRNLAHLSRLVEDMLDIAEIDAGKMRIKAALSKVNKVIQDACDVLEHWAKSRNIEITRQLEKNLPDIFFDSDKITQVLNNLVGNSIKFTPPGGKITLKSGWSADGEKVEISVIDTGAGIAKENLPKLFQRFEQFGDQQGISGTGLGLSISKEIVEMHAGRITVQSQEGKGSTFTFSLPIKNNRPTGV